MLINPRQVFEHYLYSNYDPIPPRTKAPEIGREIGLATWPQVAKETELWRVTWLNECAKLANEILKDPPSEKEGLQEAFDFYKTPKAEQAVITKIGHRRMQSPDDGAMVDLVNPEETCSEELYRLSDKLEAYGNQCIDRSKYIRQLAKLRENRGL